MQYDGELNGLVQALEKLYARISLDHLGQQPHELDLLNNLSWAYHSQGRFHEAAALLETIPDNASFFEPGFREMLIGWAYRDAGDLQNAQQWFESALAKLENLEIRLDPTVAVDRAAALAGLGRSDEAAAAVQEALSRTPRNRDEVAGQFNLLLGAFVLARIGDGSGAVELIAQLLDPPSMFLPYEIWFNWGAAPLRANPEFRELMARHGVDVTRDPRAEYAAHQATAGKSH
jgi:tetratricopeptide (TPR) repeat protein